MNIRIVKPAQNEIDDAVSWYDSQSAGLGTWFLDELDRSIRRIVSYPFSCLEIEQRWPGLFGQPKAFFK
jgi:hypothetical protein